MTGWEIKIKKREKLTDSDILKQFEQAEKDTPFFAYQSAAKG